MSTLDQILLIPGLGASPSPGPLPPELTLDSDNSSGAGSGGYAATFTQGGSAVALADVDTIITDPSADGIDTLMVVGSSISDGADEIVAIGADSFPLNADQSTTEVVGSTTFAIAYVAASKQFTITKDGGGPAPKADMESLIEAMTYENTSGSPTVGDRTFTFQITDGGQSSNSAVSTITVQPAAPSLTAPNTQYVARAQTINTISTANAGGDGTWSVTSGTLPTGLSLNTSTGDITGTVDAGATVEVVTLELTCTNGAGSDAVSFDIDVRSSFATISSGDTFPYYSDAANKLYVVTEDIASDTTGLVAIHSGVVFDLGGHTLTYNNASPISIANHSFESGTTGWDLTGASDASVAGGVFMDNEVYDGSNSLQFAIPASDQYVVSTGTVELLPSTTYTLSMMCWKDTPATFDLDSIYVSLVGTGGESTVTCERTTQFNRGMQLVEVIFTTPAGTPTYNVRIGITGATGSATATVYVDDIKIVPTRHHGVCVGASAAKQPNETADLTQFGSASDAVVTNGSITQGQNGSHCHGIMSSYGFSARVTNVTCTVRGQNSSNIIRYDPGAAFPWDILDNVFTSDVQTVTSRDAADGAMVKGHIGSLRRNTFRNGPGFGVQCSSRAVSTISDNDFAMKARYTNAFAIATSGYYPWVITGNTIDNTGDYAGRGIITAGGASSGAKATVNNNTVYCSDTDQNQEYGGASGFGSYCLQLESSSSPGESHMDVTNNTLISYGDRDLAIAMRFNLDTGYTHNVTITGNVIEAVASVMRGYCVRVLNLDQADVTFSANTLKTNFGFLLAEGANTTGFVLDGCTFELTTEVLPPSTAHAWWVYQPVDCGDYYIVDPVYADAGSQSHVEDTDVYQTWNDAVNGDGTTITIGSPPSGPAFVAATSATAGDGNASVAVSTPGSSGDGLLAIHAFRSGTAVTPSGWTQIATITHTNSANDKLAVYARTHAGGSEPSSHDFGVDTTSSHIAAILAASGVADNGVSAWDVAVDDFQETTPDAPTITVSADGSMHVIFVKNSSSNTPSSTPTGFTERVAAAESAGAVPMTLTVYTRDDLVDAGATGTTEITFSGTARQITGAVAIPPA